MKKIIFLTGTRADFGKLKSLIEITDKSKNFETHIFVTGMHMIPKYGKTIDEIRKGGYKNIFPFYNQSVYEPMEMVLSKTIEGFSYYVQFTNPDLIIVHGDRIEALAGAIVGALNNILVGHVEGGEISGTVDELIRHAISKMSHVHFVSNIKSKKRLIQMGEEPKSVFIIGSPDIDLMFSRKLKSINFVKKYYDINFSDFSIGIFHPVVSEYGQVKNQIANVVEALVQSGENYILIYPNNDLGSNFIFDEYKKLKVNPHFRIFPSLRFEYFLVLLKHAEFIIGNSSCGIREAPYYGTPTINIGTRQKGRSFAKNLLNCRPSKQAILAKIKLAKELKIKPSMRWGDGRSSEHFLKILNSAEIWKIKKQKKFHHL